MILNISGLTTNIHEQGVRMAEDIFETHSDPDQMQTSEETLEKLRSLSLDSILYKVEDDQLLGWSVVVPTTRAIADKFVNKEINEQELLDATQPLSSYDALYICAAGVRPEYRRRGVATELITESISRAPLTADYELFAWPTTAEGAALVEKLEADMGKVIHLRK